MKNHRSRLGEAVEIINKSVQIVAILVAGVWALWTWNHTTAQSLKTGITLFGDVGPFVCSSIVCKGYVNVSVENIGQRNILASTVRYELFKSKPTHFEENETIKVVTMPESEKSLTSGTVEMLSGPYAPKVKQSWSLPIFVRSDFEDEVWIKVEAFDQDNKSLNFWYAQITPFDRK